MPFSKTSSGVIKSSAFQFSFCILCSNCITCLCHCLSIKLSQLCVQLLPSFHPELWIATTAIWTAKWYPWFLSSELRFLSAWEHTFPVASYVPVVIQQQLKDAWAWYSPLQSAQSKVSHTSEVSLLQHPRRPRSFLWRIRGSADVF